MGDEKDPSASAVSETAPSAPPSIVPRPVSVVPRPLGSAVPTSRMPPPPSSRGILPGGGAPGLRSPPPPPQRLAAPSAPPPAPATPSGPVTSAAPLPLEPGGLVTSAAPLGSGGSASTSPSAVPRPAATPPPPPQRHSVPPGFARPLTPSPSAGATAHLEQRLGATQVELRKLGSERHTLRARLRRETDRLHELESALRAEKELRRQASDEHYGALAGLRTRLAELEAERDTQLAGSAAALEHTRSELAQARTELAQAHAELAQARTELAQTQAELEASRSQTSVAAPALAAGARAGKVAQGLRRIRGIGPAYERALSQLGVERVQQIAAWTDADILSFAESLKIRADRITKDDWVGQAKALGADPVE